MKPLLLPVLLLTCLTAQADIYSYINEQGERVYSDRPAAHADSQTVTPTPTNRMQAGQRFIKLKPPPGTVHAQHEPVPVYQQLQLLQPVAGQNLHNTGRSISIQVASRPALQPGHSYQLWLDGQPFGPASQSTQWTVEEVDRGSHSLQVRLLDAQGAVLQHSESLDIHLHQTSLIQKRRVNPCLNDDYGVRPECPLEHKPEPAKRSWWKFGR